MATISLCMIVKNEERVLKRCLDSIYDLVDEIVIVDTGSSDATKQIASEYTDKVFDFEWINDFSAARNYSFSKCSMDYIYVADADEYLDEANRFQFKVLKDNIYPEIEIVQMMYETLTHDTVLNVFREYRPKLFKRLREFNWINPIHETVRLDPLVFDSDIVVTHEPESNHAKRDFSIFEKTISKTGELPEALASMYAKELYRSGEKSDFDKASEYFINLYDYFKENSCIEFIPETGHIYSSVIISKWKRLKESDDFTEFTLGEIASIGEVSELFFELGKEAVRLNDYESACGYFRKAILSEPVLDVHAGGDEALKNLIECCDKALSLIPQNNSPNISESDLLSLKSEAENLLENWVMPQEEFI